MCHISRLMPSVLDVCNVANGNPISAGVMSLMGRGTVTPVSRTGAVGSDGQLFGRRRARSELARSGSWIVRA